MASVTVTNLGSLAASSGLREAADLFTNASRRLSGRQAASEMSGASISSAARLKSESLSLEDVKARMQTSVSTAQTAASGLDSILEYLEEMRTLASSSAQSATTAVERSSNQSQIVTLRSAIDSAAGDASFNGRNLLDGSIAATGSSSASATATFVSALATTKAGTAALTGVAEGTSKWRQYNGTPDLLDGGGLVDAAYNGLKFTINGYDLTLATGDSVAALQTKVDALGLDVTVAAGGMPDTDQLRFTADTAGTGVALTITPPAGATLATSDNGSNATLTIGSATFSATSGQDVTVSSGDYSGLTVQLKVGGGATVNITVSQSERLSFQTGTGSSSSVNFGLRSQTASALGLSSIDISTQAGGQAALTAIDDAIDRVTVDTAYAESIGDILTQALTFTEESLANHESALASLESAGVESAAVQLAVGKILGNTAASALSQSNLWGADVISAILPGRASAAAN